MRSNRILVPFVLALGACGDSDLSNRVPRDAPPAAAVLVPQQQAGPLAAQLDELAAELDRALGGEPQRLLTAEALTDRLMQASRSADWLDINYDLEARLRQLQAMADRTVAMLRRGAELEAVQPDVETMRRSVEDLQQHLDRGAGGPAPPSLESLLAQDPLRDAQARSLRGVTGAGAAGTTTSGDSVVQPRIQPSGGLLGSPVQPPPDTGGAGR